MTSTHVVLRRNALLISSDELGDGGVSYHVPVWLFAPDRSNHEENDATGVTNHGSKVAQLHLKICDKQRVIDVGPYGGQYRACSRAKRRHKTHNCIKRTAAGLSEAHCGHTFFLWTKKEVGSSLRLVVTVWRHVSSFPETELIRHFDPPDPFFSRNLIHVMRGPGFGLVVWKCFMTTVCN